MLQVTPDNREKLKLAPVSFVLADGDEHGIVLCPDTSDVLACKDEIEAAPDWPLSGAAAHLLGFVERELGGAGMAPGLTLMTDRRLCDVEGPDCLIAAWQD